MSGRLPPGHILFWRKQSETGRARCPRKDPRLLLVETNRCVETAQQKTASPAFRKMRSQHGVLLFIPSCYFFMIGLGLIAFTTQTGRVYKSEMPRW
jgi:hypothetical protein